MRAAELHSICKIIQKISNQSSLTSLYRSIELNSDSVRCQSEFGNIAMKTAVFGITEPVLLDTQAVVAVASSLPADSEITFSRSGNKFNWICGSAKGSWNAVYSEHSISPIVHTAFPWTPPASLGDALVLAASACQMQAVALNLYGITIEPEGDKLRLMSSNSISLASVKVDKGSYPAHAGATTSGKVTIRPPVPTIINTLLSACRQTSSPCDIDIDSNGIFLKGTWLTAQLPFGIPLITDLKEVADKFSGVEHVAKIDSGAVGKFLSRARMLSDKHAAFTISLKVEQGKLVLLHSAIAASTEEFFIADGADATLNFPPVSLPADAFGNVLPRIETVVFDYLQTSELVLLGSNPDFCYIIGGGEN